MSKLSMDCLTRTELIWSPYADTPPAYDHWRIVRSTFSRSTAGVSAQPIPESRFCMRSSTLSGTSIQWNRCLCLWTGVKCMEQAGLSCRALNHAQQYSHWDRRLVYIQPKVSYLYHRLANQRSLNVRSAQDGRGGPASPAASSHKATSHPLTAPEAFASFAAARPRSSRSPGRAGKGASPYDRPK